ncbi:unnamed protein product [Owenia fusiformis]|uniref:G-protein coupled receptors family 1 profile domain-containing protein n=1 Tax=Owenia fusiformis TaxID=6347 RepID=A0A8S4PEA0_OWEFU|nr:unnamed protein product [Owenia fusiformis]
MNSKMLIHFVLFVGMMLDRVVTVNQQHINGTTFSASMSDIASFSTDTVLTETGTMSASFSNDAMLNATKTASASFSTDAMLNVMRTGSASSTTDPVLTVTSTESFVTQELNDGTDSYDSKFNDELNVTEKLNDTSLDSTANIPWEVELWKYGGMTLIAFGVPCNILSILVFRGENMRSSPIALALTVLAVTDSFNLLNSGLGLTLKIGFGLSKSLLTDLGYWPCKIGMTVLYVMTDFSIWIIAVISIERCIAVGLPYRAQALSTKRTVIGALSLSFLILLAWNLQISWIVTFIEDDTHFTDCTWNPDFIHYSSTYFVWQDLLMLSFIPLSIVIICNVIIIKVVFKQQRKRKSMTPRELTAAQKRTTNSMALMLIAVSVVLCICTVPFTVFNVWVEFMDKTIENQMFAEKYSVVFLWMLYINYSVNFWLYVFAGSKFRNSLFKMFKSRSVSSQESSTGNMSVFPKSIEHI